MNEPTKCRTCGSKLIIRQTQKKPSQLTKAYYYTAYYYCPHCRKIYHSDKFKIENKQNTENTLFSENHSPNLDISIWTDGACVHNGTPRARAAWAFVSGETEKAGLVIGEKQTNNVAEGLAILKAIEWAAEKGHKKIKIHTDSQISLHNLNKPAKMVKVNCEIFEDIEKIIKTNNLELSYEKVLGHSGDFNNSRADQLANSLAYKNKKIK